MTHRIGSGLSIAFGLLLAAGAVSAQCATCWETGGGGGFVEHYFNFAPLPTHYCAGDQGGECHEYAEDGPCYSRH